MRKKSFLVTFLIKPPFSKLQVGSGDLTVRGEYFKLISLPNYFFFLSSIPLLWLKSRFECDEAARRALSLWQSSFSAFRRYVLVCFSVI